MTKVRDVYQALIALATDGQCNTQQTKLARLAGLSTRHLRRITQELEEIGLIRSAPRYNHRGKRAGMAYRLLLLPDIRSPIDESPTGHQESDRCDGNLKLADIRSPVVATTGHQESGSAPHDHGDMNNEVLKKKLELLNFLGEPNRSRCALVCSLADARRWRQFYDYCETNELWPAFNVHTNPPGWVYTLIQNRQAPPPLQHPLPGGAVDLSEPFRSRGKSAHEIEAEHPVAQIGAHLKSNGFWS